MASNQDFGIASRQQTPDSVYRSTPNGRADSSKRHGGTQLRRLDSHEVKVQRDEEEEHALFSELLRSRSHTPEPRSLPQYEKNTLKRSQYTAAIEDGGHSEAPGKRRRIEGEPRPHSRPRPRQERIVVETLHSNAYHPLSTNHRIQQHRQSSNRHTPGQARSAVTNRLPALPVPVNPNPPANSAPPGSEYKLVLDGALTAQMADGFCYYQPLMSWGERFRFTYNKYGMLDEHILFDHEILKSYLLDHPLGSGLTMRIQKNPDFTRASGNNQGTSVGLKKQLGVLAVKDAERNKASARNPEWLAMSSRCRFASCRSKNNTIKAGQPKLCFDEESAREDGTYGLQHNPYRAAAYMHIGCFEKAINMAHVARCFAIQVDVLDSTPKVNDKKKGKSNSADDDDEESCITDFSPNRLLKLEANVGYLADRWLWYAETRPNWEPVSFLETMEFVLRCAKIKRRRGRNQNFFANPRAGKNPQPVDYLMNSPMDLDNSDDVGCLQWDALGHEKVGKNLSRMLGLAQIREQEEFLNQYCNNLQILKDEYAEAVSTYGLVFKEREREKKRTTSVNSKPLDEMEKSVSEIMVQQIRDKFPSRERKFLLQLKAFYDDITRPLPGYELLKDVKKWKAEARKKKAVMERKSASGTLFAGQGSGDQALISAPALTEKSAMATLEKLKEVVYTPRLFWAPNDLQKNDGWGGGRGKGEKVRKDRDSPEKFHVDRSESCRDWVPEDLEDRSRFPNCSKYPAILSAYEEFVESGGVLNPDGLHGSRSQTQTPIFTSRSSTPYDDRRPTYLRVDTRQLGLPGSIDPQLMHMDEKELLAAAFFSSGIEPIRIQNPIRLSTDEALLERTRDLLSSFGGTINPRDMFHEREYSATPELESDNGSDVEEYREEAEMNEGMWDHNIDPALQDQMGSCQPHSPPEFMQGTPYGETYTRIADEEEYRDSEEGLAVHHYPARLIDEDYGTPVIEADEPTFPEKYPESSVYQDQEDDHGEFHEQIGLGERQESHAMGDHE
ncbi:hypothetical protein BJ508DRAFT_4212 [Ascobolus immersus RN42]|uniref:Uncharacterized protein n=1 Tax=Ascobolus immersus RN42 TaxID=1160509 RepID=A0A3N4ITZ6_ASCIM|nr:hypothetical protein BJ508DRAFT_4212 [Ascobolus immersus RN42]